MNVALLEKIAELIQDKPNEFSMMNYNHRVVTCGTMHCIGGWAAVLTGRTNSWESGYDAGRISLELTDAQANLLFYAEEWPQAFRSSAPVTQEGEYDPSATQAVSRIRHFIATDGRE